MFAIDVDKWKEGVSRVLDQLGVLSLLEINRPVALLRDDETQTVILPMRSGDRTVGEEIEKLNFELATVLVEAFGNPGHAEDARAAWRQRLVRVYLILLEAMDNVTEHAYRHSPEGIMSSVRRWWLTAAVDRQNQQLTVAIYDQGTSIPATLPNWHNFDMIERLWKRLGVQNYDPDDSSRDGLALKAALKIAVSSTDEEHRGKGLPIMADFLDQCRSGRLKIVSRHGVVTKTKGRKAQSARMPVPLTGTLVEWEVQF